MTGQKFKQLAEYRCGSRKFVDKNSTIIPYLSQTLPTGKVSYIQAYQLTTTLLYGDPEVGPELAEPAESCLLCSELCLATTLYNLVSVAGGKQSQLP